MNFNYGICESEMHLRSFGNEMSKRSIIAPTAAEIKLAGGLKQANYLITDNVINYRVFDQLGSVLK